MPAEYIGPICVHVCLACGGCEDCHLNGVCISYDQQDDPDE